MHDFTLKILAEADHSSIGKIIPFIFVAIWVLSGIIGTLSKKKKRNASGATTAPPARTPAVDFFQELNPPVLRALAPPALPIGAARLKEGGRGNEAVMRRLRMQEKVERVEKARRAEQGRRAEAARRSGAARQPVAAPRVKQPASPKRPTPPSVPPPARPAEVEASTTITRDARPTGTSAVALKR